ncbi:MAG TPA: hypothetical protein VFG14_04310 [Chthoniobacteraceae bacterium]|nr:hypothetical protein [Chthoniobacteraceae bacterium]
MNYSVHCCRTLNMAAEPHQTGNDRLGVVRRILPRPLALLALAIAGYLGWQSYVAMFGLEARTERTRSLLSSVTLELIEFREATQSEAVEQLRLALAEAGLMSVKCASWS